MIKIYLKDLTLLFLLRGFLGCHESCLTCTNDSEDGCTSCNNFAGRILKSSSCPCNTGYFDFGALQCEVCHYSCLECKNPTDCSSCNMSNHRTLQNNSCPCNLGFSDIGSSICIIACDVTCQICFDQTINGCLSCNGSFPYYRISFQKNTCVCKKGYIASDKGRCIPTNQRVTQETDTTSIQSLPQQSSENISQSEVQKSAESSKSIPQQSSQASSEISQSVVKRSGSATSQSVSQQSGPISTQSVSQQSSQASTQSISEKSVQDSSQSIAQDSSKGDAELVSETSDQSVSQQTDTKINDNVTQKSCHQTCATCSGSSKFQCLSCNDSSLRILIQAQCQCSAQQFDIQNQVNCSQQCSFGYQIGNQCLNCHPLCSKCTGGSPLDCTACNQSNYDELNTNQNGQNYYRNSPINLILNIRSYSCLNSVSQEILYDPHKDPQVIITQFNMNTNESEQQQTYDSLNILFPKQTFKSGQQYMILIQVKYQFFDPDGIIKHQVIDTSFDLYIIAVKKTVTISGGNGVKGNTQDLIIQCQISDFDNQDNLVTEFSQYSFAWSCKPFQYSDLCVNGIGLKIDTSSKIQNLTISAADLAPYNSYQFHVTVYDKITEILHQASVIYQVVDYNIPILNIDYDPNILALPVNLNINQQFHLNYQEAKDTDNLFYSANLYYNFDILGTIVYHYSTVNFRIWDYFEDFIDKSGNKLLFKGQVYNPKYLQPSTFTIIMTINIPPQACEISVTPDIGRELIDPFLIQILNCQNNDFQFTYRFAYYQSISDYESDNSLFSLAKANIQTSFQLSNILITYLPKAKGGSHIVLAISVQDNIGGIKNYTKKVMVTPSPIINQKKIIGIINNVRDSSAQLRYLQVDLSYPDLSSLMTNLTSKASQFILSHEQQIQVLQIQAFTSTQVSNLASIIIQQQTTNAHIINQIKSLLSYTKMNPSIILNQQKQDTQTMFNAQIDNQLILGTIILQKLIQQQNSSLEKNSTQFISINTQNLQLINLTNQIRQIKIQQMIPNEGTKLIKSRFATLAVAIVTRDELGNMLGQNIIDDTQNKFLIEQSENSNNDFFTFSYLKYYCNPYSSDPLFPYVDQGFSAIDLQITQQSLNYSSIDFINSPNIIPTKDVSFTYNKPHTRRMMISTKISPNIDNTTYVLNNDTKVCVSKVRGNEWSAHECQTETSSAQISCKCKTISPTSIVSDFKGLFSSSDTKIMKNSSFGSIESFQWQNVTLFWLVVAISIIYLVSLPLGYIKDESQKQMASQSVIKDVKVKQDFILLRSTSTLNSERIDEIQEGENINRPLDNMKSQTRSPGINYRPMISKGIYCSNENIQEMIMSPQDVQRIQKTDVNLQLNNTIKLSDDNICICDIEYQPQLIKTNVQQVPNLTFIGIPEQNTLPSKYKSSDPKISDTIIKKDKKNNQTFKEYFKVFKKSNIFQMNHIILNVYHSFESLSRPTRSSLVYLTIIQSLAVTLFFGSYISIVRSLILSILSSIATTLIIVTLKSLLSAKSILFKIVGVITFLFLLGFLVFVILAVIATTLTIEQTNIWSIQLGIQLVYDYTIGAAIFLIIKQKFFQLVKTIGEKQK